MNRFLKYTVLLTLIATLSTTAFSADSLQQGLARALVISDLDCALTINGTQVIPLAAGEPHIRDLLPGDALVVCKRGDTIVRRIETLHQGKQTVIELNWSPALSDNAIAARTQPPIGPELEAMGRESTVRVIDPPESPVPPTARRTAPKDLQPINIPNGTTASSTSSSVMPPPQQLRVESAVATQTTRARVPASAVETAQIVLATPSTSAKSIASSAPPADVLHERETDTIPDTVVRKHTTRSLAPGEIMIASEWTLKDFSQYVDDIARRLEGGRYDSASKQDLGWLAETVVTFRQEFKVIDLSEAPSATMKLRMGEFETRVIAIEEGGIVCQKEQRVGSHFRSNRCYSVEALEKLRSRVRREL